RNSSPAPAFNQPIVLDGAKLGTKSRCGTVPWPCTGPATLAQMKPANIARAAGCFLAPLIGGNASMKTLLIVSLPIFAVVSPQVKEPRRNAASRPAMAKAAVVGVVTVR